MNNNFKNNLYYKFQIMKTKRENLRLSKWIKYLIGSPLKNWKFHKRMIINKITWIINKSANF